MRNAIVKDSAKTLKSVYKSLSNNFKNSFVYEEFLFVYEFDKKFKGLVDNLVNNKIESNSVESYLLENKNLPLLFLVNSYLNHYRNMEVKDESSLIYYKNLFGSNDINSKGSAYPNYLDLIRRVIVSNKKSSDKKLNKVLSVVRKRERDRVKYKNSKDLIPLANLVIEKLESSGGSLNLPEGSEKSLFIAEFILYDTDIKGFSDDFVKNKGSLDIVYNNLFKLSPYVIIKPEDEIQKVSESEIEEKRKTLTSEEKSIREKARQAKLVERESKRKEKEARLREKHSDKFLLESDENVLAYVTKLRNFNKLLISKNVYTLTDNTLYRNLGVVLTKASSSIKKKDGYDIIVYEDNKIFEYLVEFKINDEVHLFYITPYFIVNTKTRRVFADKTKKIKSLSNSRITDFEKSFGAVIMILMKLISGRREKDRMSKEMKNGDVQRINRFAFLLRMSQEDKLSHYKKKNDEKGYNQANRFKVNVSKDEKNNAVYSLFYDDVHTSTVKIEYDKNEKPYVRILTNTDANFIITPDFIVDVNSKSYTYKRLNASAPVAILKSHLKSERSKYNKINKTDYAYIMNCILKAWDLRRRLTGYSRGFDYVKVVPSKID